MYPGETLIEQNGNDTDVFFIVAGAFDIVVNQKLMARRSPWEHIGEMAAISPIQRRSATVIAHEPSLVLGVTEPAFSKLGNSFPDMWRRVARELSRRLEQRNSLVRRPNDKMRVFVISSVEALSVARAVETAFA